MTNHKFKLKNVHNFTKYENAWEWEVHWTNGVMWNCVTGCDGCGIYKGSKSDDVWNIFKDPEVFDLIDCARSQVYTRIHGVFDRMRIPCEVRNE